MLFRGVHDAADRRAGSDPLPRRAPDKILITERDRRLLAFAAEHRLILVAHAQFLLGTSAAAAYKRLHALRHAGLLRFTRLLAGPGCYQIERRGLAVIGSPLPRPRGVDLSTYKHDLGLAWLWLAAHTGTFGRLDEVISERRMRSHDGRAEPGPERLGIRLAGVGPWGGERRHYPDLLLRCATGHRVAIELELTPKGRVRREEILGGYALDGRIDRVLYLVTDRAVGDAIDRSAAAVGISSLVRVQRVSFDPAPGTATDRGRGAIRRPQNREPIATRDRYPAVGVEFAQ